MIIQLLVFALSLLALWKSSDFLVDSACGIARKTGLSEFAIGAFIVGFGTSLPELMVSCLSNGSGNPGIALGNVFGSNIFNISCILGISALLCPLVMRLKDLASSCFALAVAQGLAWICAADRTISRFECLIMLAAFVFLMKSITGQEPGSEEGTRSLEERKALPDMLTALLSLAVLIISSDFFVSSSTAIAHFLGVPDLVIGMTVVAAGTSMPELASSVCAARKGKGELILGNIIGSNFFNCLVVLGVSGLVRPYIGTAGCFFEIGLAFLLGLSVLLLRFRKLRILIGIGWLLVFAAYFASCALT